MIIDGRTIGPGQPCWIVAEMSANHGQDLDRACAILREAAAAGADAVKVQTYTPDTLTIDCDNAYFRLGDHALWGGRTLYELYRQAYMPWDWYPRLRAVAREAGVTLFSTPFDESAVDFLEGQGAAAYKVASFELVDLPLLEKVAATGKPVILSAGMATCEEIEAAVRTLRGGGAGAVALLRCASAYPADPADLNLRTLPDMAARFGAVVGLSDHTPTGATAAAAVALGAAIVEKHFTIPGGEDGPDAAFSLLPEAFWRMVEDIRAVEAALGRVSYGPTAGERASTRFRRSVFAVRDIARGEALTRENVRVIRPGDGLAPAHHREVLGRRAARDIPRGTPIRWDLLAAPPAGVTLRPATMDDARLLYAWAMDPETRRQSFQSGTFDFEGHCRWLRQRLASADALCLVAEAGGTAVGSLRFDREGDVALVSYSVGPEARGRGYGTSVLVAGVAYVRASGFAARMRGCVRLANARSLRCFEKAGFVRREDAEIQGVPCAVYEWSA